MKHLIPMGTLALLLTAAPGSLDAQRVAADVVIRTGPVHGRVVVGEHGHRHYRPYRHARRVVIHRHHPRALHIHRMHIPRGKARGWFKRHGYRPVVVYYHDGRFYDRHRFDRYYGHRHGYRTVVVWERGGRLYRPDRRAYYRGDPRRARLREIRGDYDDDWYDDDFDWDDYDD